MLKVIETASLYSGNMRLTVLVSEFEVPFSELKREDIEGARQALDGWKAFIRGPPKRPTLDRYGRVDQVLAGLESYWDAGDSSKLDLWRKERGERLLKGIGTDIVLDSNKKDGEKKLKCTCSIVIAVIILLDSIADRFHSNRHRPIRWNSSSHYRDVWRI
jgi:hypothetical protein